MPPLARASRTSIVSCRLTLLGWLIFGAAALPVAAAEPAGPAAATIQVADFGAIPNDGKNDAEALSQAFRACAERGAQRVVFAPGRYELMTDSQNSAQPLVLAKGLQNVTVEGNQAELIGHGYHPGLTFENCPRLTVRNLTVDWEPGTRTAGRVIEAGPGTFDLAVADGYQAEAGRPVRAIWEWDGQNRTPLYTQKFVDSYRLNQKGGPLTQLIAPGRIRITLDPATKVELPGRGRERVPQVGAEVIVFHLNRGGPALRIDQSPDATVEDVKIHTTIGMAFAAIMCHNITVRRMHIGIRPGSGEWLSARADGIHFNSCRGQVVVEDCTVENNGDDGLAIHGMYGQVTQRLGERELVVAQGRPGQLMPVLEPDLRPGDRVEFGWGENPLQPGATNQVERMERRDDGCHVWFQAALPPEVTVGAVVNNVETEPAFQMRRCVVRHSVSIGARLKTRRGVVEDCVFDHCYAYGLTLCCDADKWWESGPCYDMVIQRNQFIACGSGNQEGAIKTYAGRKASYPRVHKRLFFCENTVDAGQFGGRGASVTAAEDVRWERNTFLNLTSEAVFVEGSAKVVFRQNRLPGGGQKLLRLGGHVAEIEELDTLVKPQ